ncbi:hypothetical protein MCAP1_002515 [Malassezia caprae]|uniref:Aminodeoxychorismate lyase n=1 Tax=Malassezia caprae TaxID=1381934 RepID=A0AAF0IW39_9BASI|nr:hypothetical protein MCAP1_002515 [Malassezia caprae]
MDAPTEALTSLRCYRDASVRHASLAALLPPWLAPPAEASETLDHPLAAHIPLFSAHIHRLRDAAAALGELFPDTWARRWSVDDLLHSEAVAQLQAYVDRIQDSDTAVLRASLRIKADGTSYAVIAPLSPPPSVPPVVRLDTQSVFLDTATTPYKTDQRAAYDEARHRVHGTLGASPASDESACFDVLLWHDEHGEQVLTESSIANVVIEVPGPHPTLVTPSFVHLLPGLVVQALVHDGLVQQRRVSVHELQAWVSQSARLWLCNAVRGMFEVRLVTPA